VRRIVLLSTLTPGRCFALVEPPAELDEDDHGKRLVEGRSILTPEFAWRIVTVESAEAEAENALGDSRRFDLKTRVVELPRQGWDRLAARVRGET